MPAKRKPRGAATTSLPLPPDLDEMFRSAGFQDPREARKQIPDLALDASELISLARLSGLLSDLLSRCPDPDAAWFQLSRFVSVRGSRLQLYQLFQDHPALLDRFIHLVGASSYLADILVRNPDVLDLLSNPAWITRPRPAGELRAELRRTCRVYRSEDARLNALRRAHRIEILRIAAAELLGFQDLEPVTEQVSDLADAFVGQALEILSGSPAPKNLVVIALGKWGGRELNYSSDIDPIFLTPASGNVGDATRLTQRLIRALSEPTYEGSVYRVDTRLRPYGAAGTLVTTTRMFETYLRTKAEPSEIQMMLKARAAAGNIEAGRKVLRTLGPLLARESVSARKNVRELKGRIERRLRERGQAEGHVKLGPGGIRDIEFLAQALQLESGRSKKRCVVAGGNTLQALRDLEAAALLDVEDQSALADAYIFLRSIEHRIQLQSNRQLHRLPESEADLRRLGLGMGFTGFDAGNLLLDAVDRVTRRVRAIYDRILSPPRNGDDGHGEAIRQRLGEAGERIDPSILGTCGDLLDAVGKPGQIILHAERRGGVRWIVALAALDRPGIFSLVTGLFTARGVDIRSGDLLRLRDEATGIRRRGRTRPKPRKLLNVLEVTVPKGTGPGFWKGLRRELQTLSQEDAIERILVQVGQTMRGSAAAEGPLLPVRVEIRNPSRAHATELHIHAMDTPGFVYELSTALTSLGLDIARGVIRTLGTGVYDTFWITDLEGRPITDPARIQALRTAVVVVKQFTHLLPRSPNPAQALRQFSALLDQVLSNPDWLEDLERLESPSVLTALANLMGVSRFLWEEFLLIQHENLFPVVSNVPALDRAKSRKQMEAELKRSIGRRTGEEAAARLNAFKDREMFRIDLRHITGRSDFTEFTLGLSNLARVVIGRAAALCERGGSRKRRPCRWTVGGLGKFGGGELGIASDLDLIVVYEEDSRDGKNGRFFEGFVRDLSGILESRQEGSFAVDLRLRPHGSGGAMASSLAAFREYYSPKGPARPFERMALIRLDPVAGDPALGKRMIEARDAFVFSGEPVDYEELLHLRHRQATEKVRPGELHAKLSPGGLVDVEYYVQTRQIEAGHRDPRVRVPGTLEAIRRLAEGGHLRERMAIQLGEAYVFLRRVIDALRMVRGIARDSLVPARDVPEFTYLVRRLGYASPARLEAELRQKMSFARNLWNDIKARR